MSVHSIGRIGTGHVGHVHGASGQMQGQRAQETFQPRSAPVRTLHTDQMHLSGTGLALNRLVRMWGAVSTLFGENHGPAWSVPDLSSLRQALHEATLNAQKAESRRQVMDTLKSSALAGAEKLVAEYFGLKGDGAPVKVALHDDLGGALASVGFRYDRNGRMVGNQLNVSVGQFTPDTGPNGINGHVIENDRIIAHEMTHLIMGRNMDMSSLPDWFAEGTAEYVAGGAERVALHLQKASPQQLMARLAQPWEGDSSQYAASYVAVRYLNEATRENGGLKAVMAGLKAGHSLDDAIAEVSGGAWAGQGAFLRAVALGGEGAAFIRQIDLSGRDAGSIKPGPGWSVVADQGMRREQPLQGFRIQWPSPLEGMSFSAGPFTPVWAATAAYRRHMPDSRI